MEVFLFLGMAAAWIWSVAKGVQVSLLCAVLNFLFPPISQLVYSIYEESMRGPLFTLLAFGGLFWLTGTA